MTEALVAGIAAWTLGPLVLLATWLLLAALTIGIGLPLRSLLAGDAALRHGAWFEAFWLGMGATVLAAQLWHFMLPVGGVLPALLASAGLLGLLTHGRPLAAAAAGWRLTTHGGWIAATLAAGCWLGNRALAAGANFDTDMYHIPAVEWNRGFALVPGLANLHVRFGFNNSNFLYAALLEAGPWIDGSLYLLNGFFILVLFGYLLGHAFQPQAASSPARFFALVLLAPLVGMAAHPPLFSSLSPDVPATVALFAGTSLLVTAWTHTAPPSRAAVLGAGLVALVLAVAFKTSTALFVVAAVPFAAWRLVRGRGAERVRRGALAVVAVLTLGIALSWSARSVVLSGYPLYPATVAGMPVDWRVPEEQAAAEAAWIRFFAVTYHSPAMYALADYSAYTWAGGRWVRPWVRALFDDPGWWQILLPAMLVVVCLSAGGWRLRSRADRGAAVFILIATAAFAAIMAWFVLAPRPQFGFGFFWLAAAAAAAHLLQTRQWTAHALARLRRVALGLAVAPLLLGMLIAGLEADESPGRAAFAYALVTPDPVSWLQPMRLHYPSNRFVTASGLELLVPAGHRCARAPQPCTSHPATNLRLRRPGDLASGFASDGRWRAERWPNPWSTRFLESWRIATGRAVPRDSTPRRVRN
jgi:hypothetical protein